MTYLSQPVKREPGEENIREEFQDAEVSKHNPVSEPLRIIILLDRFNGFD